ncbi:MAG: hypothetical protein ABIR26_03890 [Ramlibacter sp.]
MLTEPKTSNRFTDTPCDKPRGERVEHGNLERPGAKAHPCARGWDQSSVDPLTAWRMR